LRFVWHSIWHSFWYTDILSDILSAIVFGSGWVQRWQARDRVTPAMTLGNLTTWQEMRRSRSGQADVKSRDWAGDGKENSCRCLQFTKAQLFSRDISYSVCSMFSIRNIYHFLAHLRNYYSHIVNAFPNFKSWIWYR
jgi:uncharacterized Rmd1/YagE family protein